jgi:hypothetical protein
MVLVYDGTTLLGTATESPAGTFTFTTTALASGTHTLSATATDVAGNVSAASSAFTINVDTAAPNAPVITAVSDNVAPNTADLSSGASTNDTTPTLTFSAESGSTVQVYDGTTLLGTATESPAGTFTFTATALATGTHTLSATATDAAGNVSAASSAFSINVDTDAPNAPVITAVSDNVVPNTADLSSGASTNDTTQTLTLTAEAGSTVLVYDGTTLLGNATESPAGTFTFTTAALASGAHTLSATATDAAGNVSAASSTFTLNVDTAVPNAPLIVAVSDDQAPNTGNLGTGASTNDSTPTLTFSAEPGSTVQVYDGTTLLGTATESPAGSFTFTTAALATGTHTLSATATDAAGNVSAASSTVTLKVDTAPPSAPVIAAVSDDQAPSTGNLGTGASTNDSTPTLTFSAEPGGTVQVYDGTTLLGTATESPAGTFTFTTAALATGTHTLSATATDAAGNVSAGSSIFTLNVDTSAPNAPLIVAVSDDQALNTGNLVNGMVTNDSTLTLTFSAEPGSTVQVYDGTTLLGIATESPAGTFSFTATALATGAHTLSATATDAAGNVSAASSTFTLNVDTAAPNAPLIVAVSDDQAPNTGNLVNGMVTNDSTPTLTFSAEPGSTVHVYDGTTLLGAATENLQSPGSFSFTPSTPLPDGVHDLSATATDLAGNTSAKARTFSIQIETKVAAGNLSLRNLSQSVMGSYGRMTGDNTFDLHLEGNKPGSGAMLQVSTDGGATWSSTTALQNKLKDGFYAFRAVVTDLAGNQAITAVEKIQVNTAAALADTALPNPAAKLMSRPYMLSESNQEPRSLINTTWSHDLDLLWTRPSERDQESWLRKFRVIDTDSQTLKFAPWTRPSPNEATTSETGFAVRVSEIDKLFSVMQSLTDIRVESGSSTQFQIPPGTFVHHNPDAVVSLSLDMLNGDAPPSWIKIHPKKGLIDISTPEGLSGSLLVRVVAQDQFGQAAVTVLRIQIHESAQQAGRAGLSAKLLQSRHAATPETVRDALRQAWLRKNKA